MGELAPLGTGANRVLRARVSFSLKVESLRDEHPEVRKRLGSFESAVYTLMRVCRAQSQSRRLVTFTVQGDSQITTPSPRLVKSISHLSKLLAIYMKNSKT